MLNVMEISRPIATHIFICNISFCIGDIIPGFVSEKMNYLFLQINNITFALYKVISLVAIYNYFFYLVMISIKSPHSLMKLSFPVGN